MIGDPHPNWKYHREYPRLVALLDLTFGEHWEFVSIMRGEDICQARPEPTGRTGGVLIRLDNGVYTSIDYWDLSA